MGLFLRSVLKKMNDTLMVTGARKTLDGLLLCIAFRVCVEPLSGTAGVLLDLSRSIFQGVSGFIFSSSLLLVSLSVMTSGWSYLKLAMFWEDG